MNKKRPVNLDLSTIKFPPMAIASILHRISGVVLFLLLPLMLYILQRSLASPEAFTEAGLMLQNPLYKLVLWSYATALIYHVIAGIRHMVMDIGFGEHLSTSRRSAVFVIVLAIISSIILGIWIC